MADRLMASPEWWTKRAAIFEQWTLASLERQTSALHAVIVTMRDVDWHPDNPLSQVVRRSSLCKPLVRPYMDWQYPIAPNHAGFFCTTYHDVDWLVVLSVDSDDCYARDIVLMLEHTELSEGLVMHFGNGWYYEPQTDKLVAMRDTKGPGPFFAKVYSRNALRSVESFVGYRKHFGFDAYHWQLAGARNPKRMPDGRVLQLIHGANATTAWEDKATEKRLAEQVTDNAERAAIIARFHNGGA